MTALHMLLLVLVNAAWGGNYLAAKIAMGFFPPFWFTALRSLALTIILASFFRIVPGQMLYVVGISVLMTLNFALSFAAVLLAGDLSTIAIVQQLSVPFSTLIAVFVFKERVGWRRVSGIALAFGGVAIVSFDPKVFSYLTAVGTGVLAALCNSVAQNLVRQVRGVSVFTMQAWTAAIGGMVVMLISLAIESGQVASTLHTPWQGWSAMIYTTVISSLFGYGGLYFLLRRYSVSIVTPFATLTPIFAVLGGVALMGDQLTPRMMLGGLVTLIGVLIVSLREAPQPASLT